MALTQSESSLAALSGMVGTGPAARPSNIQINRYETGWGVCSFGKMFVFLTIEEALEKTKELFTKE